MSNEPAGWRPLPWAPGATHGGEDPAVAAVTEAQTGVTRQANPGTAASAVIATVAGLVAGSVATVMHANIWYVNANLWLPWGLLYSGALLWFASVWCGTTTRKVWAAAVPGLITYVLAWSFAFLKNGSALVVTSWEAPIGMVGYGWFVTIFLATMAAVIVTARWLMSQRRGAREPQRG